MTEVLYRILSSTATAMRRGQQFQLWLINRDRDRDSIKIRIAETGQF